MATLWYVEQDGKRSGPFSSAQLKELAATGRLLPTDLVFRQGMEKPIPADKVKGLFADGRPTSQPASPSGTNSRPNTARSSRPAENPSPSISSTPTKAKSSPIESLAEVLPIEDPDVCADSAPETEELRRRLTAYANAIPHHGIEDFGHAIKVKRITRLPVYRLDVTTLHENREAVRRQQPFGRAMTLPAPTVNEANINVWADSLPVPTDFTARTTEYPITESQAVQSCTTCQAQGAVVCDTCQGHRQVPCPRCKASGVEACGRCGGTGWTLQNRTVQKQRVCSCRTGGLKPDPAAMAGAVGYTKGCCPTCGNTGIEIYKDIEITRVQCLACAAQGRITCQQCAGRCAVQCARCVGSGSLTCPTCQGKRSLVHFLAVVQTFTPRQGSATVPPPDCPEPPLRSLDSSSDFREVLCRSQTDLNGSIDLPTELRNLQGEVQALVTSTVSAGKHAGRPVAYRVSINRATVFALTYTFQGKSYTAWLPGRNGPVHAPVSPLTDRVRELAAQALDLWGQGNRKEAVEALRDCLDMAKRSPECDQLLGKLKGQFPDDLMKSACRFSPIRWYRNLTGAPKALATAGLVCCLLLCILLLIGFVGSSLERRAIRQDFAEAEALWQAGDRAGAVGKYKPRLGKKPYLLREEEWQVPYGRVIDYDLEKKDTESARKLIADAVEKKITPAVNSQEAKSLLSAFQQEREAKSVKKQASSQEHPSGASALGTSAAYKQGHEEGQKYRRKLADLAFQTGNQELLSEDHLKGLDPGDLARETGMQLPYQEGSSERADWVKGYNDGLRAK